MKITYSKSGSYILLELPYKGKALPGQFFTLATETGPYIPRPFSVYSLEDGKISFLVKAGGEFEKFINGCATVEMNGPFGNPIPELDSPLLLSGGCGYAPVHFYAQTHEFSEIIVGANDPTFFDLIDLPDHSVYVTDPTTPLDIAKFSPLKNILLCGPASMIKDSKALFADKNLYLIMEERMACARGMCEGCAIMTDDGVKFVCKDGPVFRASEVDLEWTYR